MPKIVYSKTLKNVKEKTNWKNVSLRHEVDTKEIKKLKKQSDRNIAIFGSNNLATSFLEKGLLDEVRIMVNPIVIGQGSTLFKGIKGKHRFKLLKTKTFSNGNVLLYYQVK